MIIWVFIEIIGTMPGFYFKRVLNKVRFLSNIEIFLSNNLPLIKC